MLDRENTKGVLLAPFPSYIFMTINAKRKFGGLDIGWNKYL
jgi:hypothetical protein